MYRFFKIKSTSLVTSIKSKSYIHQASMPAVVWDCKSCVKADCSVLFKLRLSCVYFTAFMRSYAVIRSFFCFCKFWYSLARLQQITLLTVFIYLSLIHDHNKLNCNSYFNFNFFNCSVIHLSITNFVQILLHCYHRVKNISGFFHSLHMWCTQL